MEFFFHRLGRKNSFYISIGMVIVASSLLTAFWSSYENSGNTKAVSGYLTVFSMFLFMFGYAWNMNTFSYTYIPEICPTHLRAAGTATAMATVKAVTILLVQVGPLAMDKIGWRYFIIFLWFNFVFVLLVYFT